MIFNNLFNKIKAKFYTKTEEQKGIYNVTFKDKEIAYINLKASKDIEVVENAVIDNIILYVKGWHNIKRDKGKGANHIKIHLEKGARGEITLYELLNIGNSMREYIKQFEVPFIESNGASNYEWQNKKSIRFRIVIDKIENKDLKLLKEKAGKEGHSNTPLSLSSEMIITFYSDRNLNKRMDFKNPKVKEFYAKKEQNLKNKIKDSELGAIKRETTEAFEKIRNTKDSEKSNKKEIE